MQHAEGHVQVGSELPATDNAEVAPPLVSIIVPSFNSAAHVGSAIASVQAQTYPHWELLVVDGGSRDATRQIVERAAAQDGRIRFIPNPNDQGPAHARATAIRQARGAFVAFLDADDLWLPGKLLAQLNFMQQRGVRFSYTRYRSMSADGAAVGCLVPMRSRFDFSSAIRRRGIGALTVMVARELLADDVISVWRRAGGEDSLWWFLILRKGAKAHLLDEDLARYRDTAGSLSKSRFRTLRTVWSMYRVELGLPVHRAAWDYLSYFVDSAIRKTRLKICFLISGMR